MLERDFQKNLIKELKEKFEGCYVLKNDGSNTPAGFPDLTILYKDKWAALECKKTAKAHKQPGQPYYISQLDSMSFAKFISPENKENVLYELQQAFGVKE